MPNDARPTAFHGFVLDHERGDLRGPQGEVHLRPQAFRLLEVLVESAPRVVPHDELIDRAWGASHLSASALKQTVSELRQALGDNAGRPRFIATVPRRGYRFIAPLRTVEPVTDTEPDAPRDALIAPPPRQETKALQASSATTTKAIRSTRAGQHRRRRWPWLVGVLVALVPLALWLLPARELTQSGRPSLAILGFKNLAAEKEGGTTTSDAESDDWVGTALEELFGLDVVASGHFRWVSSGSVATMRRELDLDDQVPSAESLRRIRRYSGADFVVRGSYLAPGGEGGRLEVQLVALDTRDGEAVAAVQSAAAFADMIPLAHRLARRLWSELGAQDDALFDSGPSELQAALPRRGRALKAYARGTRLARQLNWQDAIQEYQTAADLDPTSPLVHSALAQAWESLGFDLRAAEDAQRALQLATDLPAPTRLAIEARSLATLGRRDEAIVAYEVLLRLHQDDLEVALALTDLQRRAGRLAEAEATLSTFLSTNPSDPRLDLAAARLAFSQGEAERGFALCRNAEAESAERGTWHVSGSCEVAKAWERFRAGDTEAALHAGRSAIRFFETSGNRAAAAAATLSVASFLSAQGHTDEAARDFHHAIDVLHEIGDRDYEARARNNLAALLANVGRLPEAIAQLEHSRALQIEVGDTAALLTTLINLAQLYRNAGDRAQASSMLTAALALRDQIDDPHRIAQALRVRARLHQTDGNLDLARDDLREALALFTDQGEGRWAHRIEQLLALLAFDQGQHEAGDALLERALDGFTKLGLASEVAEAREYVARWALRRGRFEAAARELEQLLAAAAAAEPAVGDGQRAAALVIRADAHRLAGRLTDASNDLDRAVALFAARNRPLETAATRLSRARLDLERGDPTAVVQLVEALDADAAAGGSLGLSLEIEALRARTLATTGDCAAASARIASRGRQLGELRTWEHLAVRLDFALAQAACGVETALDEIVAEAARLGYLELELRALWHHAHHAGDQDRRRQVERRAEDHGFAFLGSAAARAAHE